MRGPAASIDESAIAAALRGVYIPKPDTRLRAEEAQKVRELSPLLREIDRVLRRLPRGRELLLVDAAAGRGYVSFLSARLLLAGRRFRWVMIERDAARVRSCHALAASEAQVPSFEVRCADVRDAQAWPMAPDLVVALHACGPAADAIIDRAAGAAARHLLLVPCCVSKAVPAHIGATAAAEALRIPRQAQVRRKFVEAMVAAERTRRLEALGYAAEVVELCSATITPHNLLWRCRRS